MTLSWKKSRARPKLFNTSVSVPIQLYTFRTFNMIQKYTTGGHMLTSSHIFLGLITSTLVSDLYGSMWRIVYVIFVAPCRKFAVPWIKHYIIKNGTLYGVSYLYAAWLLSITLSLTLYLWSTRFLSLRILYLLICICFCRCINLPIQRMFYW